MNDHEAQQKAMELARAAVCCIREPSEDDSIPSLEDDALTLSNALNLPALLQAQSERDEALKELDGRVGAAFESDVVFACKEYIAAEDELPEHFDTEDYCLSNAVKQLVCAEKEREELHIEIGDIKTQLAELETQRHDLQQQLDEKIAGVLMIRCTAHYQHPQINKNEHGGGECGACIALQRDAYKAVIDAALDQLDRIMPEWKTATFNGLEQGIIRLETQRKALVEVVIAVKDLYVSGGVNCIEPSLDAALTNAETLMPELFRKEEAK